MTAEEALEWFYGIASDMPSYEKAAQKRAFHAKNDEARKAILERIAIDTKGVADSVNGKEPKRRKKG